MPVPSDPDVVCLGDKPSKVRKVYGKPDRKSSMRMDQKYLWIHQWVYEDRMTYVYILDGKVVAVRGMWENWEKYRYNF